MPCLCLCSSPCSLVKNVPYHSRSPDIANEPKQAISNFIPACLWQGDIRLHLKVDVPSPVFDDGLYHCNPVGLRADISYGMPQALPWWTSQTAVQCEHFGWATWGLFSWPFGRDTRLCRFGGRDSPELSCPVAILELFLLYSSLSGWCGVWRLLKWVSPVLSPSCCIIFQRLVNILICHPNSTPTS